MAVNRRIVLARRPEGRPRPEDFRLEEVAVPRPGPGQVLVQNLWLSLDPYMRARMGEGRSYARPVGIGEVMVGGTVGRVVESNVPGIEPGGFVVGRGGWQEWSVLGAQEIRAVDPALAPLSTALGVLGMPGLTAYVGLRDIARPKPGETLVVAAATGPVGGTVGQLARLAGARVVGIAGGPEKCRLAVERLGFQLCLDHRSPDLPGRLAAACPDGIDVYWENVGGAVLEAVLPLLNDFARVPVCGLVAWYNATEPPPGPDRLPALLRLVLTRRLLVQGFIVTDRPEGDFRAEVGALVRDGRIAWLEDVREGLEAAPAALVGLLEGENRGKLLVRLAAEPTG
jgi:hypothetical protein